MDSIESISVPTRYGTINAGLWAPSAGDSPAGTRSPGLILLHDFYGMDEHTRAAAARLSAMGFKVLAPDLFTNGGPTDTSSDAALADWTVTVSDSKIVAQIRGALDALAAQPSVDTSKLGIVGWGWGGTYSLLAAAHDRRPTAVADIGGDISYAVLTANRPGSPLNFVANLEAALFAAFPGDDPAFPVNEAERLRARLTEHDKRGEVKVYPDAPARFWRQESLPQTVNLWRRLEGFLRFNILPREEQPELPMPQAHPEDGYPNEESRIHA
jgi:carboxymethylenebutenolidase